MECKFRARFVTKIRDQIKNSDHKDFSLRNETMYPKTDYFSLISIETTHNIDGIRIAATAQGVGLGGALAPLLFWMLMLEH